MISDVEARAVAPTLVLESAAFRGFFDAMPDAILVCDVDGIVVLANRKTELLTGYAPSELEGVAVETLLPTAKQTAHAVQREGYREHPAVRGMGTN